ncbi:zinc transporter [Mycolicibacterium moriokaense]|nr:zinc transporter [Mycolicibacterium moriokaense]
MTVIVVLVVSGALIAGAAWGIYGRLPEKLEGFVVAVAGGALIISVVLELVEPATKDAAVWLVSAVVFAGAAVFSILDFYVKKKWGSGSGGGLLAAITLDGIPENLALGVALIGAGPLQVAALSGSIFLSNLPEAAGGAKEMSRGGQSDGKVFALWTATAVLLSAAALIGNFFLAGVPSAALALVKCFAGGAVVASLATEVFPKAFKEESYTTGVAAALGLVMALGLDHLS